MVRTGPFWDFVYCVRCENVEMFRHGMLSTILAFLLQINVSRDKVQDPRRYNRALFNEK